MLRQKRFFTRIKSMETELGMKILENLYGRNNFCLKKKGQIVYFGSPDCL